DLDASLAVFAAVIVGDVVADDVVFGVVVGGVDEIAGAVVAVGIVVLHDRIGHVPVEIEPAAVADRARAVVEGLVVLHGDAVGSGGPDSDGGGAGFAVVVGG